MRGRCAAAAALGEGASTAEDDARALSGGRRAVLRSDALKRYGDGDAVTVNSVRLPSQTRRAFAHSPLAEPSLRAAGHGSAAAVYRYTGLERSVCVRATRATQRREFA